MIVRTLIVLFLVLNIPIESMAYKGRRGWRSRRNYNRPKAVNDVAKSAVSPSTLEAFDPEKHLEGHNSSPLFKGPAGFAGLGDGDNNLMGKPGEDTLDFSLKNKSEVYCDLQRQMAYGPEVGFDKVVGYENVRGSAKNDILRGDTENNKLEGLGGNDEFMGRGGVDLFDGGPGVDTVVVPHPYKDYMIYVEEGKKVISYSGDKQPKQKAILVQIEKIKFSDQTYDL